MEAANRWETEAIRESRDRRRGRPTVSQQRGAPSHDGDWRTLREASDETGIPVGTLRKWCRRESVDSYLESDGEQNLRMLEMGSVEQHARAMGRDPVRSESKQPTADSRQPEPEPVSRGASSSSPSGGGAERSEAEGVKQVQTEPPDPPPGLAAGLPPEGGEPKVSPDTMIVPVDAWNKMLTQLGNLHEAGQQLAEARERAAKAETEATFLRERLVEMRNSGQQTANRQQPEGSPQTTDNRQQAEADSVPSSSSVSSPSSSPSGGERTAQTTSFWRYVVRGWKGRHR